MSFGRQRWLETAQAMVGKGGAFLPRSSCLLAQEGNKLCHFKLKEDKGDGLVHSF